MKTISFVFGTRPEAIEAGTVLHVGTDSDKIKHGIGMLWDSPDTYAKMAQAQNPCGDGKARGRIVDYLQNY